MNKKLADPRPDAVIRREQEQAAAEKRRREADAAAAAKAKAQLQERENREAQAREARREQDEQAMQYRMRWQDVPVEKVPLWQKIERPFHKAKQIVFQPTWEADPRNVRFDEESVPWIRQYIHGSGTVTLRVVERYGGMFEKVVPVSELDAVLAEYRGTDRQAAA
jgi:hypothetical protein